jgi:hypothetical protein
MKKKGQKLKTTIKKHLKEDIHESKESMRDDKKLMKKMKKKGC